MRRCVSRRKKYVVAKTLPDEEVLCEVKRKSGNAVICDVKEILEKSGKRVEPRCKYYDKCGGCNLLHTTHRNQLEIKTALVRRKFAALGFSAVSDAVGFSEDGSRNKTHIVFGNSKGQITAGFSMPTRTKSLTSKSVCCTASGTKR